MPALVLVVEDEPSIRQSVVFHLRDSGYRTAEAEGGQEALAAFRDQRPDLVILDVMLPDLSGLEVCAAVRAQGDVPILFLTARGELEDKVQGLDAGGDDYLAKPFRYEELMARVRALLRRPSTSTKDLAFGELRMDPATRTASFADRPLRLTLREYELLELFLRRPREVLSKAEIRRRLWDWEGEAETNVVEVHVCALRAKLGDPGRDLIRTVRGVGYALGSP